MTHKTAVEQKYKHCLIKTITKNTSSAEPLPIDDEIHAGVENAHRMGHMTQTNDLKKTQFSEQVQTILISLEFLQKLSLTQNGEIKLREGKIFFMCWKLSVISFVKSNISKRSPVFFQYTNYGKRELRVMVIIMSAPLLFDMNSVRSLTFNCSATS